MKGSHSRQPGPLNERRLLVFANDSQLGKG